MDGVLCAIAGDAIPAAAPTPAPFKNNLRFIELVSCPIFCFTDTGLQAAWHATVASDNERGCMPARRLIAADSRDAQERELSSINFTTTVSSRLAGVAIPSRAPVLAT